MPVSLEVYSLQERYESLSREEKQDFRKFVKETMGRTSKSTAHSWITGTTQPAPTEKIAIASWFRCSVEEIFTPEND